DTYDRRAELHAPLPYLPLTARAERQVGHTVKPITRLVVTSQHTSAADARPTRLSFLPALIFPVVPRRCRTPLPRGGYAVVGHPLQDNTFAQPRQEGERSNCRTETHRTCACQMTRLR